MSKTALELVKEQIAALTGRQASEVRDEEKLADFEGDVGAMTVLMMAVSPESGMTVGSLAEAVGVEMAKRSS